MNFKLPALSASGQWLRNRKAKCSEEVKTCATQPKTSENNDICCNSTMKVLFGCSFDDFSNWNRFVQLMNRPMDPSSLGILRIMFGFLMVIDTIDERGMAHANVTWGNSDECRFPLFSFLQPLPSEWMYIMFLVQMTGAFGIMIGLFYRVSCILFVVPYWYIFLLEKTLWNNHSYLYGLIGLLFLVADANRYCSLDGSIRKNIRNSHMPLWIYCLFRSQIFIVYFIAGIKKLDSDWLFGYSMRNLSGHWVFSPFRLLLSKDQVDFWIIHQGGFMIDLFIGFVLFFDVTRWFGLIFGSMFHVMNSLIFPIGMFPYVMLATLPLFCPSDWPKKVFVSAPSWIQPIFPLLKEAQRSSKVFYAANKNCDTSAGKQVSENDNCQKRTDSQRKNLTFSQHMAAGLTIVYIVFQLFLPFSHFLTPGYNNWTNGLYGYSWDMMVYNWQLQHIQIRFVNQDNGETGFLNPEIWTMGNDRWSSYADMQKQMALCISKQLKQKFNMNNTAIYFDIWKSLNERFHQRMVDPRIDLVKADWNPFEYSFWVLPLLTELSDWRSKLTLLEHNVRNLSNNTDVTFIADFPGLYLENFIEPDLDDVEILVLSGSVLIEIPEGAATKNVTLETDENLKVPSGQFHKVYTVSDHPACYMYTFINKTQESVNNNNTAEGNITEIANNLHSSDIFIQRLYKEIAHTFQMTKIAVSSIITGESFESVRKRALVKEDEDP